MIALVLIGLGVYLILHAWPAVGLLLISIALLELALCGGEPDYITTNKHRYD